MNENGLKDRELKGWSDLEEFIAETGGARDAKADAGSGRLYEQDILDFTAKYGAEFRAYRESRKGEEAPRQAQDPEVPERPAQAPSAHTGVKKPSEPALYEDDMLRLQAERRKAAGGRAARRAEQRKRAGKGRLAARIALVALTTVMALVLSLAVALVSIVHGPSPSARDTFVTTVLESGNLKFLATLFLSDEEIREIVSRTSMEAIETHVDADLIGTDSLAAGNFDENGVEIVEINGRSFFATLMIVQDPSKVFVGTTYPWGEYGKELGQLTEQYGAVGGINGGLYAADLNKGGRPYGVCVSKGEIQLNAPGSWAGLYMIGFDSNNILRVEDIEGWSADKFKSFVEEEGIRDAVAFQDESSDSNNHFVPLIINGEARQLNGAGSGANPRTVIGQRADGAVLLLVTDGRGAAGHLGATAQDLINIMLQYGAVNAANLDGGSSSSMYYSDAYLMTSVTLYYANASWKLPTAFLVMGRGASEGGGL